MFVNHVLSGVQQRNLERALQRPVLDRVALIIEIFSQRARTAEVAGWQLWASARPLGMGIQALASGG